VSGSLQDLDRALIIGSPSFGKGLVQNYKNLPYRTQMKITTARYHIPSGRCIQKRDYRRSETSPKQAFKTKNGRIVFDGSGVQPDVNINQSAPLDALNWMKRELILFDYTNQKESFWKTKNTDDAFQLLSDFNQFATVKGAEKISTAINQVISKNSDSSILNQVNFLQVNTSAIEKWISQDIKNNQEWYLYELRQALYTRWYDKSEYHKTMLNRDPLINQATAFLMNPERINKIVNPK
jgi:carboxyl-terminal processing protease